jgi:hypothetical protein
MRALANSYPAAKALPAAIAALLADEEDGGQSPTRKLINNPDFWAPLKTSIVPTRGAGSPSFTRATAATVQDWEGRVYSVLSGEVRFQGARRVRNLIPTKSQDFTNAVWQAANATKDSATQLTFLGAVANVLSGTILTGNSAIVTCRVKIRGTPGNTVNLYFMDVTANTKGGGIQVTLTAADQVISFQVTIGVAVENYAFYFSNKPALAGTALSASTAAPTFFATEVQAEDVSGQSNTNPSEYVSVGVFAAPYHGSNVDGVKCFAFQNGNTVASNVVTESTGAAISSSVLLGYLDEQQSTNLVLRSEDFSNASWASVGTPTLVSANRRCGSVVLDLLGDDDAGVLEGKTQTITFTGNAVKAFSIFFAQDTSTSSVVRIRDTTAGADRLLCAITWSGGVPTVTMTTGTLLGVDTLGNSCFRARVLTTSVTAANVNSLQFYPATDAALSVGNTGRINWGGVQPEDNVAICTSYIPTTTATVTRNGDLLTHPSAGNVLGTVGACYAEVTGDGAGPYFIDFGSNRPLYRSSALHNLDLFDGASAEITNAFTPSRTVPAKVAAKWGSGAKNTWLNGVAGTASAFDGDMNVGANMTFGSGNGSVIHANGTVREVKIWLAPPGDAQMAAM